MFVHPTDDYDFIVHLDSSILPRRSQNVLHDPNTAKTKYANQRQSETDSRVGFNPAHLLFDDLTVCYKSISACIV